MVCTRYVGKQKQDKTNNLAMTGIQYIFKNSIFFQVNDKNLFKVWFSHKYKE
jgi:hypothetical protein